MIKNTSSSLARIIAFFLALFLTSATAEEIDVEKLLAQADNIRSSNPVQSIELLRDIENSKLTSPQRDLLNYLWAYNLSMNGQLDQAIEGFKQLTADSTSEPTRIRALSSLIVMFAGTENWSEGFSILPMLLNAINHIDDPELVNTSQINILVFYNLIGEHNLAITFANKVLSSSPSPRNECNAKTEQLYARIKSSINDVSEHDFYNNELSCKKAGESVLIYSVYVNFAEFYFLTHQVDKAISLLQLHLSDAEKTGYHTLTVSYYQLLAEYLFFEHRTNETEFYAQKILSNQAEHQNASAISSANYVMFQISQNEQKYHLSLNYYLQYAKSEFRKYEKQNAKLLAVQKAKLDNLEKSNRIALLDKENALLKTQAALVDKQSQNERLALALVSLLLLMLIIWVYRNRRFQLQFRRMAQTDELTGIANRHHFTEQAQSNLNFCRKSKQPLSFIIFDLDHFKNINDSFGHQIGDWALKAAVKAAHSRCRKNDIIGRIGGEEFAILLPGCDIDKAMTLAESCRTGIAAISSKETGKKFQITASFGVTDTHNFGYNFDTLFVAADDALYHSKKSGRNKVYCNTEQQPIKK
ncbi:GGDEF domain-containing protein [Paraglaciecola sp.]|uniref:GGDEF domain-containing protein n=1 Tax=Paraglaciecola sp. TaxID=1920173 RepID=UPI0030F37168